MKNRINWIDVGKGIGILLVVLGHSLRDSMMSSSTVCNAIYTMVYAIHMPFLMYLSGYMFAVKSDSYLKKGIKEYGLLKVNKLMKPYLVYAVIVYAVIRIAFQNETIGNILTLAGYQKENFSQFAWGLLSGENAYSFHLWYIYCLTVLSILGFVIWKITDANSMAMFRERIVCAFIIVVVLYTILVSRKINAPRIISATTSMFPWYFMGCLRFTDKFSKKTSLCSGIISISVIVLYSFQLIPISVNVYRVIKYVLVTGAIFGMIALSKAFSNSNILSYLGTSSMVIYLFHQPFIAAGIGIITYDYLKIPMCISIALTTIASLVLPLIIATILKVLRVWTIVF